MVRCDSFVSRLEFYVKSFRMSPFFKKKSITKLVTGIFFINTFKTSFINMHAK